MEIVMLITNLTVVSHAFENDFDPICQTLLNELSIEDNSNLGALLAYKEACV